ncbi:MAG: AMP-binding protein, partial [Betaproteobacteria bacterium]
MALPAVLYPSLPQPQILRYTEWLKTNRGLSFDTYEALWRWSVSDLEGFWSSVWSYFEVESDAPPLKVLADEAMPGAQWFTGVKLNFTRQVLRHSDAATAAGHPALVYSDEQMLAQSDAGARVKTLGWDELQHQVAAVASHLRSQGVQPGDRVCAVLPHVPETIVLFLATAAVGAVWSLCSPDMGPVAILDRFRQIEPVVLVMAEGYTWGGVRHDRQALREEVLSGLPT